MDEGKNTCITYCKKSHNRSFSAAKYFQNSQLMLGHFSGCGEPYDTRPPPDDGIDADVSIRQVPWLASLGGFKTRTKWDHQCGGSLVTNKHVLTAAHWWVSSTSFGFPFVY